MNPSDKNLLENIEDQMKVKEVLDLALERKYTSVCIVGMSDSELEVMHYTDYGGILAVGMLELAKNNVVSKMRSEDDGE